ncbi:MAG TPA: pentapeptide repeat-containing protein [Caulobacteraceae bacterium]|jgi:uncharacterized protein YjbI with pentapeptide repeats
MSAPPSAARRPWDQREIDRAVGLHERFLKGAAGGQRAFLRFVEAPGLDCQRRLLNDADFTGANLEGSALAGSHFERAAFYSANLEGCDLRATNFRRADLRGARLAGAVLSGAVMDEADMRAAYIAYPAADDGLHVFRHGRGSAKTFSAGGYAADFTNAQMRGVRLCAANLKGANFTGAVLDNADLSGARLADAVFRDTAMEGVDLAPLGLSPAQLQGCVMGPDHKALSRAELIRELLRAAEEWVLSEGAAGAPASIDDADLRPLPGAFRGRTLTALVARRVRAIRMDFTGSTLQGAVFDGADLRGAIFDGCDLRGASFRHARLAHARFVAADLTPLALPSGRAHPVSFDGATLDRADFARAKRG